MRIVLKRILGIDPGLCHVGFGLIQQNGHHLSHVHHGVIHTNPKDTLPKRLKYIHDHLCGVIETYEPHAVAVEETFVNCNPRSALRLGMARGVAVMVAAHYDIPVFDYAANTIKKSVVGVGHAKKDQVSLMVQRLLPGCGIVSADGADALAVAICHGHYDGYHSLIQPGLRSSR